MHQARGNQVTPPGGKPIEEVADIGRNQHLQLEVVRRREGSHQFVFEAEELAPPQVVGRRLVDGEHTQATGGDDALPIPDIVHVVDRVLLEKERVEYVLQNRVVASQGPGVIVYLRQFAQLFHDIACCNDHPRRRFVHDRRVDDAVFDERLEPGRVGCRGHRHAPRLWVVPGQRINVGGVVRNAETTVFGNADDPLPGARKGQRKRDPLLARVRHGDVRHRDVGATLLQATEQFVHVRHQNPLHRQAVQTGEALCQALVGFGGESLGREGLETTPGPPRQANRAAFEDRRPVLRGPHRGWLAGPFDIALAPEQDQQPGHGRQRNSAQIDGSHGFSYTRPSGNSSGGNSHAFAGSSQAFNSDRTDQRPVASRRNSR